MATTLTLLEHLPMGPDGFLLRLQKPEWTWEPGQLIGIQGESPLDQRDYTIASSIRDQTLDVVYRLIPHGVLTPFLNRLRPGDTLQAEGPYGRFTLRDPARPTLFCATGTGIAPCRAFLRSHDSLNLTLLHGVRSPEDLYFREEWNRITYLPFCSQKPLNGKTGRLTDALPSLTLPQDLHVYLCGGNEMIYEAEDILKQRGVPAENLFHEPYYYRAYDA